MAPAGELSGGDGLLYKTEGRNSGTERDRYLRIDWEELCQQGRRQGGSCKALQPAWVATASRYGVRGRQH